MRECDRLHRSAKAFNTEKAWVKYRKLRNKVVSTLRSSKRSLFISLSGEIKDLKQFWASCYSMFDNHHHV